MCNTHIQYPPPSHPPSLIERASNLTISLSILCWQAKFGLIVYNTYIVTYGNSSNDRRVANRRAGREGTLYLYQQWLYLQAGQLSRLVNCPGWSTVQAGYCNCPGRSTVQAGQLYRLVNCPGRSTVLAGQLSRQVNCPDRSIVQVGQLFRLVNSRGR